MNYIRSKILKVALYHLILTCAFLSLLISLIAVVFVVLISNSPKTFDNIDKMIPDLYGESVRKLHSSAINSVTKNDKFKYYTALYQKLENINRLNKFYHLRNESAMYLIEYYTRNKETKKALSIAEKSYNFYPSDFDAKFVYASVLEQIDKTKSLAFYQFLLKKHDDIKEVRDMYLPYIFNNHLIQSPLMNSGYKNNDMQFFTISTDNKLTESSLSLLAQKDLDNHYTNFQSVFLKNDIVPINHVVNNVNFHLNNRRISLSNSKHELKNDGYSHHKMCDEPFFVFGIPSHLQYHGDSLQLKSSCQFSMVDISSEKFLNNSEWQFFVDSGKGFNQNESVRFNIEYANSIHHTLVEKKFNNIKRIRLDFPSILGMRVYDFKISIDNSNHYMKKDITDIKNVHISDDYIEVINKDPFIIIDLPHDIEINKINIQLFYFGVNDD